jgi:hypothetical protein
MVEDCEAGNFEAEECEAEDCEVLEQEVVELSVAAEVDVLLVKGMDNDSGPGVFCCQHCRIRGIGRQQLDLPTH